MARVAPVKVDGQRLRELRENAGMTLAQLAAKASVSTSHLSYLEIGERSASPPMAARIAQALGVAISDLRLR